MMYNSRRLGIVMPAEERVTGDQMRPKELDSRKRFRDYMAGKPVDRPPMFESQFPQETVDAWRRQGLPPDVSPHEHFGLDERERVPVRTSRVHQRMKPITNVRAARRAGARYFSHILKERPPDWLRTRESLRKSEKVIYADIYSRGFLQEMGVRDSPTLTAVLLALHDEPKAAEVMMGRYADFLVEVIYSRYEGLDIEYFFYSEPIAYPKAPVISPDMYRRFVLPTLARVVHEGKKIGVREHFLWTAGGVRPLIPLWLEAGINGLWIGHAALSGIDYLEFRREYGTQLSLWGGIDNRALYMGAEAIDAEVERIAPLFSSGRYIAMIDDTIRPDVPFEAYARYRTKLNLPSPREED